MTAATTAPPATATTKKAPSKNVFYLLIMPQGTMEDYTMAAEFIFDKNNKLVVIKRELNQVSRDGWDAIWNSETGRKLRSTQGVIFELVAEGDNFIRDAVATATISDRYRVMDRSIQHCGRKEYLQDAAIWLKDQDLSKNDGKNRLNDINQRIIDLDGKGVKLPDITAEFPVEQENTLSPRTYDSTESDY